MSIGRKIIVRVVAHALRDKRGHGHPRLSETEVHDILTKACPHRDLTWRMQVIEEAQARNARAVRL